MMFGNQVVIEDSKEADKTTGQATHRISKGLHEKVHFSFFLYKTFLLESVQWLHLIVLCCFNV